MRQMYLLPTHNKMDTISEPIVTNLKVKRTGEEAPIVSTPKPKNIVPKLKQIVANQSHGVLPMYRIYDIVFEPMAKYSVIEIRLLKACI